MSALRDRRLLERGLPREPQIIVFPRPKQRMGYTFGRWFTRRLLSMFNIDEFELRAPAHPVLCKRNAMKHLQKSCEHADLGGDNRQPNQVFADPKGRPNIEPCDTALMDGSIATVLDTCITTSCAATEQCWVELDRPSNGSQRKIISWTSTGKRFGKIRTCQISNDGRRTIICDRASTMTTYVWAALPVREYFLPTASVELRVNEITRNIGATRYFAMKFRALAKREQGQPNTNSLPTTRIDQMPTYQRISSRNE
ncbi:MAG: hypothetical protein ACI915_003594 [Gammaproteobacteria bacterium]|jgi:hypothetical protein